MLSILREIQVVEMYIRVGQEGVDYREAGQITEPHLGSKQYEDFVVLIHFGWELVANVWTKFWMQIRLIDSYRPTRLHRLA